jgi:PAS domain-containing protein
MISECRREWRLAALALAPVAHPIEVILLRELADHLATPIFIVDVGGDLLFYNEPAERLLGSRFDETGMMPFEEWATVFNPTDVHGAPMAPEELPLAIALHKREPAQGHFWIRGLDDVRRELIVTAIPLKGQWGDHLGACAIFWERS